ncbi:hypothetical protein PG985_006712 [Apiospora marii]|uniref:Uncharacterized protein n=1 Tax=Apiospora marii TaxID=335849 RepID=A0ABR1S8E7_9PEZI
MGFSFGYRKLRTLKIFKRISFQQTTVQLPQELLMKPGDDEKWERCFVSRFDISHLQPVMKNYPQLHIVGETEDGKYLELAMCQRWVQCPTDISFHFQLASKSGLQYDVSLPTKTEIKKNGIDSASEQARKRFVSNAVSAVLSGRHGKGLEDYYRDNVCQFDVPMAINVAKFLNRVFGSENPEMRERICEAVADSV